MSDELGKVKDWHNPRNENCENNRFATLNCTCKRIRKRSPFKRVVVHDASAGHNVNPNIVLEIWPKNGVLVLREKRRRTSVSTTTAEVYAWLVRRRALAATTARREARKQAKRLRSWGVRRR